MSLFCSSIQSEWHIAFNCDNSLVVFDLWQFLSFLIFPDPWHLTAGPFRCLVECSSVEFLFSHNWGYGYWGRMTQKWDVLLSVSYQGYMVSSLITGQVPLIVWLRWCLPCSSTVKFCLLLFDRKYVFIYFWLGWFFIAGQGLSLVCNKWVSHGGGFSCCGARVRGHTGFSSCCRGLSSCGTPA